MAVVLLARTQSLTATIYLHHSLFSLPNFFAIKAALNLISPYFIIYIDSQIILDQICQLSGFTPAMQDFKGFQNILKYYQDF